MTPMEIELDPPNGITGFPFGMPRDEVRRAAEAIGEVQTLNDGPPQPWSVTQIDVVHPRFAITFNIEDTKTLTSVEVWRPQPGPKEITVTWRGIDIFDTPADEVLDAVAAAGYDIGDRDGFNPEVPHLTLGFAREPSDDNPINDRHMPTYFTSVLAAPKAYYD
ncbi:hypothetical protein ABH926_010205 [Catenulispora sp. GP43]